MLRCGRTWQPRRLNRVVETFRTSTRVAKIETDAGLAFVKGMGNPSGPGSLISELVCAELASWFGLEVPDFAIVDVEDLQIPMEEAGLVQPGPAFASREINLRTADGTDQFLRSLGDPSALARLVLFDTWVRNGDRCPPLDALDPEPRYENLVFRPEGRAYKLVALDHTHCFTEGDLASDLVDAALIDDERIYGLFPEFQPFLEDADIHEAAARLGLIDDAFVWDVVGSIPAQWGFTAVDRKRLATLVIHRARFVAHNGPVVLAGQLGLALGAGGR